jgi:hypothetical protein
LIVGIVNRCWFGPENLAMATVSTSRKVTKPIHIPPFDGVLNPIRVAIFIILEGVHDVFIKLFAFEQLIFDSPIFNV